MFRTIKFKFKFKKMENVNEFSKFLYSINRPLTPDETAKIFNELKSHKNVRKNIGIILSKKCSEKEAYRREFNKPCPYCGNLEPMDGVVLDIIEDKNVYKLKIQQISILYSKWEKLFNELIEKYSQLEAVENVRALLGEFKNNIKSTLKEDYKMYSSNSTVKTDNDTIRMLLSKLNSRGKEQTSKKTIKVERKQPSKDMLNSQTELNRIEDKAPLIKPICNNMVSKENGEESLVDKFLKEDNVESNAYSNIITSKVKAMPTDVNETGFDLKEAINPKEDLSEIMKAFDFFNEEE